MRAVIDTAQSPVVFLATRRPDLIAHRERDDVLTVAESFVFFVVAARDDKVADLPDCRTLGTPCLTDCLVVHGFFATITQTPFVPALPGILMRTYMDLLGHTEMRLPDLRAADLTHFNPAMGAAPTDAFLIAPFEHDR